MKTMNMISRRSFLKAAMAASAVSALALTGCGGAASSTGSTASGAAASSEAASSAVAGETFKVGIVNYVDHASLNQIVASVESRLDELGKEKGITFDYADYYANAQADQSNLNQIGADLVADGVDVIVAVATPTAATMLAAVEDTEIPVVYSAVTDPAAAGFDGGENMTGTSDALNTAAIMNLILAADPEIDTIGLLYDLSQDSSTQAIADAKAFCDEKGIQYIEKNGTTTAEVQMAAEALVAAGVKAVFTPTDNTIMTAELSIYETFTEAGVMHFTGADSFALNGAFVGYGVDYVQLGEATADMVAEILCDGKSAAEMPYQTFDNGIVTINTETAASRSFSSSLRSFSTPGQSLSALVISARYRILSSWVMPGLPAVWQAMALSTASSVTPHSVRARMDAHTPCHTGVGRASPPSAYSGCACMMARISSLLISLAASCSRAASAACSSSAP